MFGNLSFFIVQTWKWYMSFEHSFAEYVGQILSPSFTEFFFSLKMQRNRFVLKHVAGCNKFLDSVFCDSV